MNRKSFFQTLFAGVTTAFAAKEAIQKPATPKELDLGSVKIFGQTCKSAESVGDGFTMSDHANMTMTPFDTVYITDKEGYIRAIIDPKTGVIIQ